MVLARLRIWVWIHKWSSLACTLFLLVTCLTGLPLIFHDELDEWLSSHPPMYHFRKILRTPV